MRRLTLLYIFANLFNVWLHQRQLAYHICFYIRDAILHVVYPLCNATVSSQVYASTKGKWHHSMIMQIVLASWTSWPKRVPWLHFENCWLRENRDNFTGIKSNQLRRMAEIFLLCWSFRQWDLYLETKKKAWIKAYKKQIQNLVWNYGWSWWFVLERGKDKFSSSTFKLCKESER